MRKTIIIFILFLLVIGLSACSNNFPQSNRLEADSSMSAPDELSAQAEPITDIVQSSSTEILPEIESPQSEQSQESSFNPVALSSIVYPEWIFLSEVYYGSQIYSPIDHDYNQKRLNKDFIDSYATEFRHIWRQELEYQYNKCIDNMPEDLKEQFASQQRAWEEYYDNNVFPTIAMDIEINDETGEAFYTGYGYVREAQLISLDQVRRRTIEVMRIQQYIDGIDIEFSYKTNDS